MPLLVAHTTLLEILCHGSIICLFDSLCLSQQSFSYVGTGQTGTKQELMCLAQGHKA